MYCEVLILRSKLGLLPTILALLLTSTAPDLAAYNLGVSTGKFVQFQVDASWSGPNPSAQILDLMQQSWTKITVQSVVSTNITAQQTTHYHNGTERIYALLGNLAEGEGNLSIAIIPSGLTSGAIFPVSLGSSHYNMTINSTLTRTFIGASRSVNFINSTHIAGNYTTFYWDKATGFILQWLFYAAVTSQGWVGQWNYTAIQTNLWSSVPSIPSSPLIILGVMLATFPAYLMARRRR